MRFSVELSLENEYIPKDKNRIILSILKKLYSTYNQEYYEELYKNNLNKIKDFSFALYLKNCKFLKEEILIPDKKIILNFSAYNYEDGINFYNSFLGNKIKNYPISNNTISFGKIKLIKEKMIYDNEAIFKTMSPIVVREHKSDNKKTWYHSLNSEKGQAIFMDNLKYQLNDTLGERVLFDFEDIKIEILRNKEVKVKNYGIEVLSNISRMKINAKPYILEYLYKAGIGSKRGSGFGMLEKV